MLTRSTAHQSYQLRNRRERRWRGIIAARRAAGVGRPHHGDDAGSRHARRARLCDRDRWRRLEERGSFTLSSGATGRFSRHLRTASEGQGRHGQPLGARRQPADTRFTVAGPGVTGTLEGRCGGARADYRDRVPAIETSETLLPLRHACTFLRDGRPVGGLVLDEVPSRRVVLPPGSSDEQVAIAAGLALALFRDPAAA